jgi:hypothetical protein
VADLTPQQVNIIGQYIDAVATVKRLQGELAVAKRMLIQARFKIEKNVPDLFKDPQIDYEPDRDDT